MTYVEVPVRLSRDGLLVSADEPYGPGEPLAEVLAATPGDVLLHLASVPGDEDFDAPVSTAAHLLAALAPPGVTVASADWYACRVVRDAGMRVAFRTPRGVALDAAVAYAAEQRFAEVHPHPEDVTESGLAAAEAAGIVVQTTTESASGTDRNLSRSTSPR